MTRFSLVRHGAYGMIDHGLGGRAAHDLDEAGRAQAERLAGRLERDGVTVLVSSPVARVVQTAIPTASRLGLTVQHEPAFTEIEFAGWTGRGFDELQAQPAWQAWNRFRSTAPVPDGETMLAVQSRAVGALGRLAAAHPGERVAVFTHGDVIKAALAHFLGSPLDLMHRLTIEPASISRIELHPHGAGILDINQPA